MNKDAVVVLLGGGVESSTLLAHVIHTLSRPVLAISFNYGQLAMQELGCAKHQAEVYGEDCEHMLLDITTLAEKIRAGTSIMQGSPAVPNASDAVHDEGVVNSPTYVPYRNLIFLSIAASIAEVRGIRDIFYGAHTCGFTGYWDCTEKFVSAVNEPMSVSPVWPVCVSAPFMGKSKAEIIQYGLDLSVDFLHTWSCYREPLRPAWSRQYELKPPCGTCDACASRFAAFKEVGVEDPITCIRTQK